MLWLILINFVRMFINIEGIDYVTIKYSTSKGEILVCEIKNPQTAYYNKICAYWNLKELVKKFRPP